MGKRKPLLFEIEETREKILLGLRAGASRATAAASADVNPKTFREWMERGVEGEEPYAAFYMTVLRTEADTEIQDLARIAIAARKDWRAAAWRLGNRFPERYSPSASRPRVPGEDPPHQPPPTAVPPAPADPKAPIPLYPRAAPKSA